MNFDPPLIPATLLCRYKRFLADVRLDSGEELTVHTPNTGSMLGCADPGTRIWLRDSANPARKYRYSWELASSPEGIPVGVNTHLANRLVEEAIEQGVIPELQGYTQIRREVKYAQGSRIDLLLSAPGRVDCYVEVKNVTALDDGQSAIFPDAPTERGRKHLQALREMVRAGYRAVLVLHVARDDARTFRPAAEIDPAYARLLGEVHAQGVEVLAWVSRVSAQAIDLYRSVPVRLA
ncbi:DNA/RNA nuclease SfsA [Thiohalophilus thiocyanatoxydans]|uniref:Sugar fermentation stimulation protein homolog n=1 Tax=Thiohalophilus thiocyanatoxydans TaxID=381308 RepID=A0A4R8IU38_9GAMM|nr:DNA/RNA nuclease SfsA [Thiohalophilus thiocyanatoxydans]TDY02950.1 sugar fermentation stimulation protein A [Thiohalophilus thiocyanatoxydans]